LNLIFFLNEDNEIEGNIISGFMQCGNLNVTGSAIMGS